MLPFLSPNGLEFELTLGDGEGQGSLVCCSPWGHKNLDVTDNWTTTKCLAEINTSFQQSFLPACYLADAGVMHSQKGGVKTQSHPSLQVPTHFEVAWHHGTYEDADEFPDSSVTASV